MREREDQEWVFKWEEDLPPPEDLMPITQNLITPDLAAAFKIPQQQSVDSPCFPGSLNKNLEISLGNSHTTLGQYHHRQGGMDSQQQQQQQKKIELEEEESSVGATNTATTTNGDGGLSGGGGGGSTGGGGSGGEEPARTLKRPRLVWTPQLHKRFVDAVAQLGIKNAVPKTIMQLMNVEGLTRENVASHLQKYRLYLKRMQGFSSEGPSSCDHLFASTPVPPSHFLPREDVVMPLVPMLGHGHLVAPPQAQISPHPHHAHHHLNPHYAGFDPRFLAGAIPRQQQMNSIVSQQQHQRIGSAASVINREFVVDDLVPTSSPPPRQVLTLFPTSGGDN